MVAWLRYADAFVKLDGDWRFADATSTSTGPTPGFIPERQGRHMVRRDSGPRRSASVDAYLRGTWARRDRAPALVGGALSDALEGRFWADHALLAGLVASVIVVMLTVALVNEAVERCSRQRPSGLAQYVMLQLVRDAWLVRTGVPGCRLMPAYRVCSEGDVLTATTSIDAGRGAIRYTERPWPRWPSSSPTRTSDAASDSVTTFVEDKTRSWADGRPRC